MASYAFDTFTCFPYLPVELQKQVWEQAAADLPVLDIQRFAAEITVSPQGTTRYGHPRPLLCFTPHADFIDLTTGHRGLLRACKESKKGALPQIDCWLPVQYLTTDADGKMIARQALVPFNPSGQFCISGLGRAILDARRGLGARGTTLPWGYDLDDIQIPGETTSLIKNLMVALDPPREGAKYPGIMNSWGDREFERFVEQLPNVETASLIGEGIVDRRHQIDQFDFRRMHTTVAVVPKSQRRSVKAVNWNLLWSHWRRQKFFFYAIMKGKIEEIERDQSHSSVDGAAMAARKKALELNLRALA